MILGERRDSNHTQSAEVTEPEEQEEDFPF
jgi:hypothetical protein